MRLNFQVKDVIHSVVVKFIRAFLPGAKKKYYAKAVLQPELDVHAIASKAVLYNIHVPPEVIETGFNAAAKLIYYLVADGYKINTPLFKSRIRVPGEFDATETHLPEGVFPEVKMSVAIEFLRYVQKYAKVIFDGIEDNDGLIGQTVDESTGEVDQIITRENIITLNGYGLKVKSKVGNENEVGIFFRSSDGTEIRAKAIAVNEPCTLRVVVPSNLIEGESYSLIVRTQSSAKSSTSLLKYIREVVSEVELAVIA